MSQVDQSAKEALDSGLFHVNVSTKRQVTREEMMHALRSPDTVLNGADRELAHALRAFMAETHETLLAKLAKGGEVSWQELRHAAEVTLRPGDENREWIVERALSPR
jgi:hypothetical protein